MKPESFYWTNSSQKQLAGYHWPVPEAEMVVVLQHGFGEHAGRYGTLVDFFQHEHQAAVLANDRLGHGRSQGLRGHSNSVDPFLEEIDHLLEQAQSLYPKKPVLLFGHSLGGMLVLQYVFRRTSPKITGVVASGPWLRLAFEPPKWKIALGRLVRGIWPSMQQASGLNPKHLCTDADVVAAYERDPLVHSRVTPAAGFGIMEAGEELLSKEKEGEFSVPILIMHGEADQVTSIEASRQFASQHEGVEFKSWPGLFHEIHNEPNKIEVLAFAGNWFDEVRAAEK